MSVCCIDRDNYGWSFDRDDCEETTIFEMAAIFIFILVEISPIEVPYSIDSTLLLDVVWFVFRQSFT
jgi:hypothetical protein